MNEILIYGGIYEWTASEFIKAFAEIEGDTVIVRMNTDGGDPLMGHGMVARLQEFEGNKTVKVDGKAYSTGFFMCLYADNVECLDVSQFMVHRASYGEWFEKSEYFTQPLRENLASINADLEKAFRNKLNVAEFEKIKGVKVKDIFSMDSRIDVFLTAKEAKQVGLVSKINTITPKKAQELKASFSKLAARYDVDFSSVVETPAGTVEKPTTDNKQVNNKNKYMTIEQFKAENPELFAQIEAKAVATEKDRVNAWLKFVDVDAKAVTDGIKTGENLSQEAMADFSVKMFAKNTTDKVTAEGKETVVETTVVDNKDSNQPNPLADFKAEVFKKAGLKS
jgi:ATP-dependent protease ClpP protease subunit